MKRKRSILVLAVMAAVLAFVSCSTFDREEQAFQLCAEAYDVYWATDWNKVIELTTLAIKKDPRFPWPYSLRGAAHSAMRQYEDALSDLSMAIELKPDFGAAYTNRGITYMRMENIEEAEKDFQASLKLNSGDLIALVKMSEIQSMKENSEESCLYMKRAIRRGFQDIEEIEKNINFGALLYSNCFSDVMEYYESVKNQKKPTQSAPRVDN